ncbi:hypothetical protein Trydic_g14992 [Trypoxylus dichotomus]
MKTLVRLSQRESFSKELGMLKNTENITKGNFGKQKLSRLILEHEHRRLLHAGPQHVLASVREHYWLTGGRNLARSVVHKCIACFKTNPVSGAQLMGNLPKHRLESIYPFYVTGTDYAGPLALKNKPGRGAKTIKCYLCTFICLTTKAIHLEPVLTTNAFIATFRRFVSRRALPSCKYSDNCRNFIGAKSQLGNLDRFLLKNNESLSNTVSVENVNWYFILAYSPHQAREARVRPMYTLSSSYNDFEPITPSHFLIGRKVTRVPDPNVTTQPVNRLASLQLIQRLTQIFWKRWSVNYVSELQQRTKWIRRNTQHYNRQPGVAQG